MKRLSTEEYIEMIEELETVFKKHGYTLGMCAPFYPKCEEDEGIVMQIFVEELKDVGNDKVMYYPQVDGITPSVIIDDKREE